MRILRTPDVVIKTKCITVDIEYQEPEVIKDKGLELVKIYAKGMTAREFTIQFEFPNPEIISTQGYEPD